ncbi:MAG: SRPBCC domain-containing protein [Pirellulaceae bacterium]
MIFRYLIVFSMICLPSACLTAQQDRAVYEYEIDANVDSVWKAFSTAEGLKTWMAPLADIDLKIGGKMRSNYNAEGRLGDETTIESTILSFDPRKMISLKATKYPKGFPFENAAKSTWSVFYFTEITPARTKITVVGLGYTDDEDSQKMRSFFEAANKQVLDELSAALTKGKTDGN